MDQPPSSRLLGLPPELRTTIYDLILENNVAKPQLRLKKVPRSYEASADEEVISYSLKRQFVYPDYQTKVWIRTPEPPLLLACKQIYREAIGVYYFHTTFDFSALWIPFDAFRIWWKSLSQEARSLVHDVRGEIYKIPILISQYCGSERAACLLEASRCANVLKIIREGLREAGLLPLLGPGVLKGGWQGLDGEVIWTSDPMRDIKPSKGGD